jgi:hypothetical protein
MRLFQIPQSALLSRLFTANRKENYHVRTKRC